MAIANKKIDIPKSVKTKIYKTGQTRGADDDVIYQNRVSRNSTVLIPYSEYDKCRKAPNGEYENGFIVLINPEDYFDIRVQKKLKAQKLELGRNLLVFYETRTQWLNFPIEKNWEAATSRRNPLLGQYVARVPATTSHGETKILEGYTSSDMKGAGIRVYEYADKKTIDLCKVQLEFLFWSCIDIGQLLERQDIDTESALQRMTFIRQEAIKLKLADKNKLENNRMTDSAGNTICPLCLRKISAIGFCDKIRQERGREVPDLTVTEVSLFHIRELRSGEFNHRPYNLGWGHHHCNVVVKDSGIDATLRWMKDVLERNGMCQDAAKSKRVGISFLP